MQLRWPATKKKLQNMPSIFSGKKAESDEGVEEGNKIKMIMSLVQKGVSSVR